MATSATKTGAWLSSCAGCGTTAGPSDRFCARCGLPLGAFDELRDLPPASISPILSATVDNRTDVRFELGGSSPLTNVLLVPKAGQR